MSSIQSSMKQVLMLLLEVKTIVMVYFGAAFTRAFCFVSIFYVNVAYL